jgi:hypothetical protein
MKVIRYCVTFALALLSLAAAAQINGQVPAERATFDDVFASSARFYPGQRVRIRVDGAIDANHRYWKERECSWFGLKCKYVNRESSNLLGPDRLPLLLAFHPLGSVLEPAHAQQTEWFNAASTDRSHLPIAPSGSYDVTVRQPGAGTSVDAFTSSVTLKAMVADKYDASAAIDRGQCHNRPPVCSSGVYKVSVAVENSERLALLRQLLQDPRTPAQILDIRVLDPLFVQDDAVKVGIADALLAHAKAHHAQATENARRGFIRILTAAAELDPKRAEIFTLMAATYVSLGEFTAARADIQKGYESAKEAFDKEPLPRRASVVIDLAQALSVRASIWIQERAEVVGTDLIIAVNLHRESAQYCSDAAPTASATDKAALWSCAKDRLVDAGRTLAKLGTRDNLRGAEQMLSQAQDAARSAVDAQ